MLPFLRTALERSVKTIVVTRPVADFKEKDYPVLEETLASLRTAGLQVVFKSSIHQKCAICDQKIVEVSTS